MFVSMVLLLGSALCYWLSMVLLDWTLDGRLSYDGNDRNNRSLEHASKLNMGIQKHIIFIDP